MSERMLDHIIFSCSHHSKLIPTHACVRSSTGNDITSDNSLFFPSRFIDFTAKCSDRSFGICSIIAIVVCVDAHFTRLLRASRMYTSYFPASPCAFSQCKYTFPFLYIPTRPDGGDSFLSNVCTKCSSCIRPDCTTNGGHENAIMCRFMPSGISGPSKNAIMIENVCDAPLNVGAEL